MNVRFHVAIVATTVAAVVALGLATASSATDIKAESVAKGDRLPIVAVETAELTVETRGDGVSYLTRMPVTHAE